MRLVGFEHVASTDADKAKVNSARQQLENPLVLFCIPKAAGLVLLDAWGKDWEDEMAGWEYREEDGSDEEEDDEEDDESDEETAWFDAKEEAVENEGED